MSKYTLLGTLKTFNENDMPDNWYSDSYTVSTQGGHGNIWKVKVKKDVYNYTISTDTIRKVQSHTYHNQTFAFKKHYVLTEEGWSYIYGLLVESKL